MSWNIVIGRRAIKNSSERAQNRSLQENFSLNVLVLEDDDLTGEVIKNILEKINYNSIIFKTGEDLIEQYKIWMKTGIKCDFVLLDLINPLGMGGRETLNHLRKIDPKVKSIVCSGSPIENFREFGFNRALKKPFTIDEFIDTIKKKNKKLTSSRSP